ncbi:MAG: hypothetical protein JNL04_18810 [Rhodospirillaceae bacterium]|nr:hypothetical protein [Rhodospirillaceae bacterium]
MSSKMPPVPPTNRNPKDPENDPQVTPEQIKNRQMEQSKSGGAQENIHQNTRNQGNPTSRGGNPHAR